MTYSDVKPKRPNIIVLAIILAVAVIALWSRFGRQLDSGDSFSEVLTTALIAFGLVGIIVGGVCWNLSRLQKAQQAALRGASSPNIVFGSTAISAVAMFLKAVVPALGLGSTVRGLLTSSPTVAADEAGLRVLYGGSKLNVAYAIPRDRIVGVSQGEVQQGLFVHAKA